MEFMQEIMLFLLGAIFLILGVTMLKHAARQGEPGLAKRYQIRGTIYFVLGTGSLTMLLLKLL